MRKAALLALSLVLILLVCSCELTVQEPAKGRMHILVYGNDYRYGTYQPYLDKYKSKVFYENGDFVGEASSLQGTVNDAYQVGLALCALSQKTETDYEATFILGVEGKTVTDPNAKVVNDVHITTFMNEMDALRNRVSDSDLTIIYFSGHGFGGLTKLPYGNDPATESYLALRRNSDSTILYKISEFLGFVEKIPGTKVILGDFCHSGALVRQGNVSVTAGEFSGINATKLLRYSVTQSPSVYCLSAARYFEKSWEPGDGSHGYFTEALLKGLGWDEKNQTLTVAAAQDNGMITLLDLARYITANDGTAKQTPMTSGGSNDIILFSF